MELLHWELSVLSRAVQFQNLSQASCNVGLSQPQLSRIVSKIESNLDVVLLDREARRKSAWTPLAYRLVDRYGRGVRSLTHDIELLLSEGLPEQVRLGTLEGLAGLATQVGSLLTKDKKPHVLEIDVFDLHELESRFLGGKLDLILSSREPGMKKFKNSLRLGFQTLEEIRQGEASMKILSEYELGTQRKSTTSKTTQPSRQIVSNSLEVRRLWIGKYGGSGFFPGPVVSERRSPKDLEVLLIATDTFSPRLWELLKKQTSASFQSGRA